ncbi:hypothetical protein [Pseudoduganella umbonata]|uniref:Uncharacterized protein n=1 Tax=Pseudoduganella umbonata TaxID=864828 RepID=A0A4P8HMG4_9BURK|nr:hypothetical protein [Pseudoduganella umbonata]MBB3220225.1 hypothetical protein [Pseudoduganella umbonata]QCP10206.1 hypothetical protein FCL38_07040 [Pseudoduganella umbonata]
MPPRSPKTPPKKARSAGTTAAKKSGANKPAGKTGNGSDAPANAPAPRARAAAKGAAAASPLLLSDDVSGMVKDLLGNLLWDLLKEGWHQAAPLLADLANALPLAQFATLTGQPPPRGARGKAAAAARYDAWFDGVMTALVQLRQRAEELDYIAREFEAELEDIVARAAEMLVDAAAQDSPLQAERLMREVRNYFNYIHLDRTLPAKGVAKKGGRPKI